MKENLSINNSERNLKRWKPLSKDIDIEFEASKIIEEVPTKLRKGDSAKRISAIQFYFEYILRSPEESEWKVNGVVKKIMEALKMPVGSRQTVVTALRASLAGEPSSASLSKRGRKKNFPDYSPEAEFICNMFENTDSSDATVAATINLGRVSRDGINAQKTSRSAVRNFRVKSELLDTIARDEQNFFFKST